MWSLLFHQLQGGKQSASRPDVLSAAGPDGGEETFGIQPLLEFLDGAFIGRFKRGVRYRVEPDQVDPATDPIQDPGQLLYMRGAIVKAFEKDVLKGYPALPPEIP
jgi:hypothetical protein